MMFVTAKKRSPIQMRKESYMEEVEEYMRSEGRNEVIISQK